MSFSADKTARMTSTLDAARTQNNGSNGGYRATAAGIALEVSMSFAFRNFNSH